ncbi:MAG: hypothetical protein KGI49_03800 [Patescibacteria group bacterium]|nr:hypothetical protein [Patescibacteria group bacterium]
MKKLSERPPQGWDLHRVIGDEPRLRWLLDHHKEIIGTGRVPFDFETMAENWLIEHLTHVLECESNWDMVRHPGVHPIAIINGFRMRIEEVLNIFKSYGIIDEEKTVTDFERMAAEKLKAAKERQAQECPI